jgi:hypothetical protein
LFQTLLFLEKEIMINPKKQVQINWRYFDDKRGCLSRIAPHHTEEWWTKTAPAWRPAAYSYPLQRLKDEDEEITEAQAASRYPGSVEKSPGAKGKSNHKAKAKKR